MRAVAAARRQREVGATAALVSEIFAGRAAPLLAPSVAAALEQFHDARGRAAPEVAFAGEHAAS